MVESAHPMTRRSFVVLMVAAGLTATAAMADEPTVAVVHKDPNCGCCTGWVRHLRDAGFAVRVEETSDLKAVRARFAIPENLAGCHTAEIAGYLVEGHVPAAAIRRLLAERPNARGLAVPGMPAGSPGMEGGVPESYAVLLFGPNGSQPFMRFIGKQTVG
ncbi:DUF411 domain-containing protein [Bradyrhizobium sp. OHSU_III]|jgi:hypothetical protein|uniref:DUF411 domain-containing protein n=1 Tax=Bradyrhizobium sp. OHSU_III TaxID=1297865 RepID=UPI00041FE651|nr:DUF411 domain-containing protein [Bradyrhizobium sp. OHSU_III]